MNGRLDRGASAGGDGRPEWHAAGLARGGAPWLLIAAFAVLAIFVAGCGHLAWREQNASLHHLPEGTLGAIAYLQAAHVATWLRERRADAEVVHDDEMLGETAARLRSNGDDPSATARARSYLDAIPRQYRYADVMLVSPDGAVLERAPRAPTDPLE